MSEQGPGRLSEISAQVETVVRELVKAGNLMPGRMLVIGTSTSEVLGKRIGTAGALETAARIYAGVEAARNEVSFIPVYQCCEHLNRALVMERASAEYFGLTIVHAVPMPQAGGSMAAYAFSQFSEPCLVESIQAHAGIDIGDTLIGMHLRPVAVPVRPSITTIGGAHVTMAFTRPKLIGGARAVYEADAASALGQSIQVCD